MISPNPTPIKIPQDIQIGSTRWKFFNALLRALYALWYHVSNTVNSVSVQATTVGNVGTGEDDLLTYALDANSIAVGGAVRMTAWGVTANNANSKILRTYFGSFVLNQSVPVSVAGHWWVDVLITPTEKDAQRYVSRLITDTTQSIERGTLTENDSAAILIKCTGEATADDDIQQLGMIVEYLH